jgi:hypothetical protein
LDISDKAIDELFSALGRPREDGLTSLFRAFS